MFVEREETNRQQSYCYYFRVEFFLSSSSKLHHGNRHRSSRPAGQFTALARRPFRQEHTRQTIPVRLTITPTSRLRVFTHLSFLQFDNKIFSVNPSDCCHIFHWWKFSTTYSLLYFLIIFPLITLFDIHHAWAGTTNPSISASCRSIRLPRSDGTA